MRIGLDFRVATPADLDLLRHWDEQPHVIAARTSDDWGWEAELRRLPDWREQLIAEIDGRAVGFVQIIDPRREDSHYWGEVAEDLRAIDIWIGDETDLGKGHGTTMMELALARCFGAPAVSAVLVDPLAVNVRVHRFYERLGFRFVERRYFGEDECFVYRLDRADYRAAQQHAEPERQEAALLDTGGQIRAGAGGLAATPPDKGMELTVKFVTPLVPATCAPDTGVRELKR